MSKLDEIKERWTNSPNLQDSCPDFTSDYNWLIQQAEEAEMLKADIELFHKPAFNAFKQTTND